MRASWFRSYSIKQEASTKNEDAPCAFNFASNAEDNEAHTFFSLLLKNQFISSLERLLLYSIRCEFFALLVEMDTATVFNGYCLKYVYDLEGGGLADSMM